MLYLFPESETVKSMIILIAGDTHTGKTLLAQRLLEKYNYPYLSIDHLKMGLIRSGICTLSAESPDKELTDYLWNVVREIIKTCIENGQHLIVEGCYIPFDWEKDFSDDYAKHIRYVCLILSRRYIESHFADIVRHENVIEKRLTTDLVAEELCRANEHNLLQCQQNGCNYVVIDTDYLTDIAHLLSEGIGGDSD